MKRKSKISYAQAQLKFEGTQARALAVPLKRERQILIIAASVCMLFVLAYGYFVAASVAQAGARTTAIKQTNAASADLATLEAQYLDKTRGITEEYAHAEGYVASTRKVFVERSTVVSYATPDAR